MKSCIFKVYKDVHSFDSDTKYEKFKTQFGPELDKKEIIKYSKRFLEYAKKNKVDKAKLLKSHSLEEWELLDESKKCQHSFNKCNGCEALTISTQSTPTQVFHSTPTSTPVSISTPNVLVIDLPSPGKKCPAIEKEACRHILNTIMPSGKRLTDFLLFSGE